jgi:NAD(P)-dependent dehydrogenase (short-subunit alcohol dehydrogenase family)
VDLGLKNKVALVTGGASQLGFGRAAALTLADAGCDIIVADLDLPGASRTAEEVKALGRKSAAFYVDVTSKAEVGKMVASALEKFPQIDILVNNAGAAKAEGFFGDTLEKDWEFVINVNLIGPMNCTKALLKHMVARKSGKIINIASSAGLNPRPNVAVYCAAKAGVIAFTKSLAYEVAQYGIYVNGVAPGMAKTRFAGGFPQELMESERKETPLGRSTVPQDIANAVLFLASDLSNDVVGEILLVSGGHN